MRVQVRVNEQGTLPNGEEYVIVERNILRHGSVYIVHVGVVDATFKNLVDAKIYVANYK